MIDLEFHFDFRCPNAYFSQLVIPEIKARSEGDVADRQTERFMARHHIENIKESCSFLLLH